MTEEILTKVIVDCSTNTSEVIPLTEEEIVEYHARIEAAKKREAEKEAEELAKAEAKASALAKLAALGLTEEEIKAFGF